MNLARFTVAFFKRSRAWAVSLLLVGVANVHTCLADEAPAHEKLIDRLDPQTRGKVVLALAGLVMLGLLMMGLTWLAFRMARRQFQRTGEIIERHRQGVDEEDWTRKPLAERSSDLN